MAPPSARSTSSLDRSLLHGLAWTGIVKWTTQLLRWGATLAIARFLAPGDYGLVGMAMVYVGFVQLFNEFGLSSAIIQKRDLDERQIAELGGLALMLAVGLFALSAALALPISLFFREPGIRWIVVVLSTKFIIDSLGMVPRALLAKELRFNRLATIEGVEAITLAAVTLVSAVVTRSYWSLVAGLIVSSLVASLLAVASRPRPPALPRKLSSLAQSMRFGRDVVIETLAWYAYSNSDFVIVGRVLDKVALGAYTLAWNIASVPVEKVSAMINRVAPAILAEVQHDVASLQRYFLALTEGIAFITLPMSIGLALVTEDLVLGLLGEQWRGAVVPLRLLAFYAGFRSTLSIPPLIQVATGHTRTARNFRLVMLVVLPLCFLVGSRWGTTGVAAAWIVGLPLCVIPMDFRFTFRLLGMPASRFLRVLWAPLSASAIMAIVVLLVAAVLPRTMPHVLRLAVQAIVGAATYAVVVYRFHGHRLRAFREMLRAARSGGGAAAQPAAAH